MRRQTIAILAVFAASQAVGQDVSHDFHLDFVPRTTEETARISAVVALTTDFSKAERFEERPAGAATVRSRETPDAFSMSSENLPFDDRLDFIVGQGLFRKLWVSSPSSTLASDGLGPLFNARSCQRCHINVGRGHPPANSDDNVISLLVRVSVPGTVEDAIAEIEDYIATAPEPTYGEQLQDFTVAGHPAEYELKIDYEYIEVPLSEGEMATLRRPIYDYSNPGYGSFHPDTMYSPRVAQQMIGLGLLEAIPAADILALADPEDANGDGISGRPNIVWSREYDVAMLGRFGHKAGMPSLPEQNGSAFFGDVGISSPFFSEAYGDCTAAQVDCRTAPHGDTDFRGVEIDTEAMDFVNFYTRNLAPPARRDINDPEVLRGKEMFYASGCVACHTPKFVTHRLADRDEQSFQLIWPYSDLLLHDMGEGLADHRPEARANGWEWRTPPLWGIGLTEQVSGHTNFLHDGRARNLLEAILWHGGEGQASRDAVVDMPKSDRAALIRFLESL